MSFSADWLLSLEECNALSADVMLITLLANKWFEVTESQEHRIVTEFVTSGQIQPLQREQSETLVDRIDPSGDVSGLQRLPLDAEPYVAMLSLYPHYECDERDGTITEIDGSTCSQPTEHNPTSSTDAQERAEPSPDIYADMLLLIDAFGRHDPTALFESETPALTDLYTLPPDVQRNVGDLRQAVRKVPLDRFHHDQPVHDQYGSAQRTSRRNRMLKADEKVIVLLEDAGIPREWILAVDCKEAGDTLRVTDPSKTDVYEIEESEYVRKTDADEERKET